MCAELDRQIPWVHILIVVFIGYKKSGAVIATMKSLSTVSAIPTDAFGLSPACPTNKRNTIVLVVMRSITDNKDVCTFVYQHS